MRGSSTSCLDARKLIGKLIEHAGGTAVGAIEGRPAPDFREKHARAFVGLSE